MAPPGVALADRDHYVGRAVDLRSGGVRVVPEPLISDVVAQPPRSSTVVW